MMRVMRAAHPAGAPAVVAMMIADGLRAGLTAHPAHLVLLAPRVGPLPMAMAAMGVALPAAMTTVAAVAGVVAGDAILVSGAMAMGAMGAAVRDMTRATRVCAARARPRVVMRIRGRPRHVVAPARAIVHQRAAVSGAMTPAARPAVHDPEPPLPI